jgi:uncharacterized protein (TIGR02996 family)
MTDAETSEALYRTLEEDPGDLVTVQVLADWYEEHGETDKAECLRWTVRWDKFPFRYRHGEIGIKCDNWHDGWLWWARPRKGDAWGHPPSCQLPVEVWKRLQHTFDYHPPWVFKEYPSVRDAYDALFAVWPEVPATQKESPR